VASLPALAAGKRTARHGTADRIAAEVDSVVILQTEVDDQAAVVAQQNNVDPKNAAAMKKLRTDVLDAMVKEKLIAAEAHRQNIQVTQSDVDAQVDQAIAGARQSLGTEKAFQDQLRREGLTEESLRKKYAADFRERLAASRLVQREVRSKINVDSTDAKAYFDKHTAELPKRPEMYRLSVILLQIPAGDSVKARARAKAAMVLTRAKAGEDFARLATLFSDDPSAKFGGLLRNPQTGDAWFTRGTYDSTFERAAFALKPGQISDLVETRFGFHVIRVDSALGDRIQARHILVLVQPDSSDSAAALEKARAVRGRAMAGEDFAKLAQQFSDDPDSRVRGGELEPRELKTFSDEIAGVVSKLVPKQISQVTRSMSGWVIFRLEEKEPPRPYTYDEIESDLENAAREEKFQTELDKWVATLKKRHRVTLHPIS